MELPTPECRCAHCATQGWEDQTESCCWWEGPRHADYPHEPGMLYDCPACEEVCYCGQQGECVACAVRGAAAG